ncbi:TPX2 (targeting protein for Xklp2) protein family [Striga hermonthica]|uniref:TPX2 (Targeting protein for Xklp2) protein family n=1 Tax=Striga hermonthica TaxID=68872 RepID=A0A9N7MU90_STRHE|nr:TPX2 (targeting protein for Xklp2) protein family [Striga hermonthica]
MDGPDSSARAICTAGSSTPPTPWLPPFFNLGMESENGAIVEDEKRVVFENSNGGGAILEVLNKDETELSKDVVIKVKGSNEGTKNPTTKGKNKLDSKGSAVFGRTAKPTLSQSISFPARGAIVRKSEAHKTEAKQGRKAAEKVSNGNGQVVKSSGKRATERATSAAVPNPHQSPFGKHVSPDGTAAGPTFEVFIENKLEPENNVLPAKEENEEDAHSITSSTLTPRAAQQKVNVSTFSFRLEQRAAKRKEFFSKIEEKIHAKEQEKSNMQAKSKENQEAEIKQLRKSLTFKATPMPSFYKEPPPKVELKKIPTTRAISPKLGRNKGNMSTPGDSLENGESCVSLKLTKENRINSLKIPKINAEKANAAQKKLPKRSSLSKPQNRESSVSSQAKQVSKEGQKEQANAESSDEIKDRPSCAPEMEDQKPEGHESNLAECNGSRPNSEALIAADVTAEG